MENGRSKLACQGLGFTKIEFHVQVVISESSVVRFQEFGAGKVENVDTEVFVCMACMPLEAPSSCGEQVR